MDTYLRTETCLKPSVKQEAEIGVLKYVLKYFHKNYNRFFAK